MRKLIDKFHNISCERALTLPHRLRRAQPRSETRETETAQHIKLQWSGTLAFVFDYYSFFLMSLLWLLERTTMLRKPKRYLQILVSAFTRIVFSLFHRRYFKLNEKPNNQVIDSDSEEMWLEKNAKSCYFFAEHSLCHCLRMDTEAFRTEHELTEILSKVELLDDWSVDE